MNINYLSKSNTNSIKGIAALLIVLHHISLNFFFSSTVNNLLVKIGSPMVAIFMFYSGFGLVINYLNNEKYLNRFCYKRLSTIVIPYLLSIVICLVIKSICNDENLINNFYIIDRNGSTYVMYSWYVFCIIFLYVLFFITFKYLNLKKAVITEAIIIILYIILLKMIGWGDYWYKTSTIFLVGQLVALRREDLDKIFKKHYFTSLVSSLILFVSTFLIKINNTIVSFLVYQICIISFIFIVLSLSTKIKVYNKFTSFLGTISYEIYLIHGSIILLYLSLPAEINNYIKLALIILTSILVSSVASRLDKLMINKIKSYI